VTYTCAYGSTFTSRRSVFYRELGCKTATTGTVDLAAQCDEG